MKEAVVLAGGLGTRLRAVVADVPKPLAPVAGRPFLERQLAEFAQRGVQRTVLSLGHGADAIRARIGPRFAGMDIVCEVEAQPLGTGGALRAALARCDEPGVLVANGDTWLDLDLRALAAHWAARPGPVIVGRHVDDAARYGRLLCHEQADGRLRLAGFAEKGAAGPGLVNSGHYLLPRDLFERFAAAGAGAGGGSGSGSARAARPLLPPLPPLPAAFSFETDFVQPHAAALDIEVLTCDGLFIDIGVPEDWRRAQTLLAHLGEPTGPAA